MEAGMRRNEGYSLIEVIVVTAIIAILAGAALFSVNSLGNGKLNKCTSRIEAALKETKVNAMSKSGCILTISCDSEGNYTLEMTGGQTETIASSKMEISYEDSKGAKNPITAAEPLRLTYERASGAFRGILKTGPGGALAPGDSYCKKIIIANGDRKQTLSLVKDTGMVYRDE